MKFNSELKKQLIAVRQDPQYLELRSKIRVTIRYIEKLEREITRINKWIPKKYRNV